MMNAWFAFIIMLLSASTVMAQQNYRESSEAIINPERGFYLPSGTRASDFQKLDASQLKKLREEDHRPQKASFRVRYSLLYRGYELDTFKNRPLSQDFLNNLQDDFNAVREAGLKMVLRFAYTNSTQSGDCPDDYKICPPYGDAPPAVVLQHIAQLKPLFRKNVDVIAVLQEGFIGIWGENYFTDYFGDASMNGTGKILDSSWLLRNKLLRALLDAMPVSRMVQVRTPQIKQKFVYGPAASVNAAPLTEKQAYKKSHASRIGFHNDCFLASADDYGTYDDYGSSTQSRKPALEALREYIMRDTKYTVVGGETCDDAFSPQNDCAPLGYAEEEMRRMHYSYLNSSYNVDVMNDWDSGGCFARIYNQLGYRFVLKTATIPAELKRHSLFNIKLVILNAGFASMYNRRPVKLVLRSTKDGSEYSVDLKINPQDLHSGVTECSRSLNLPGTIAAGNYRAFLFMPDANESLAKRPEYSVRLANEGMWEEQSGYNDLHHTLSVK